MAKATKRLKRRLPGSRTKKASPKAHAPSEKRKKAKLLVLSNRSSKVNEELDQEEPTQVPEMVEEAAVPSETVDSQ